MTSNTNGPLSDMGINDPVKSTGSDNKTSKSSDTGFYLVMLTMILAMGVYISQDIEKRYGSASNAVSAPVAADTEKAKPVAEKAVQETQVTIAKEFVAKEVTEETKAEPEAKAEVETASETTAAKTVVAEEKIEVKPAPEVSQKKAETTTEIITEKATELVKPVVESAPAVMVKEAVDKVVETGSQMMPTPQSMPAYNPYGNPYERQPYQRNYYPPQDNYYGNPYSNPYRNPYGYDPYQQPVE